MQMMKNIKSKEGLSITELKSYNLVLSGHYHCKSITDNLHYIGTPFQLSWNDYNEQKGFYVLDEKFNYEFIENTVNPKFAKIYYDSGIITVVGTGVDGEITKEEALEVAKNNYSRLYVKSVNKQLDLETFYTSLTMNSCANFKVEIIYLMDVIDDFDSATFDEKFDEEESTVELILSCVEGMTFDGSLDKNLLKELIKIEYKSASDIALGIGDE
jgi:DNA repair exonuclease SbcCD nuclease subunit